MVTEHDTLKFLWGLLLLTGCMALKNLKIYVPMAVVRGEDAVLNCTYDLEGDDLYSVKWYRHGREFFRYTPKDEMPIKQFTIHGLSIDVRKMDSTSTTIVLQDVSDDLTGVFSCEVTADQPSFFTEIKAAHLEVVELPRGDPYISGLKTKYRLDEILRANCTSDMSFPATNLTWYVNGDPVNPVKVQKHKRVHPDGYHQSADSILRLPIEKQLFSRGRLKIRCVSSLYDVYYKSSEKSVELQRKRHKEHHTRFFTPVHFITTTFAPPVHWGVIPQASERHPQDTTLIFETKQRPYSNSSQKFQFSVLILTIFSIQTLFR